MFCHAQLYMLSSAEKCLSYKFLSYTMNDNSFYGLEYAINWKLIDKVIQ